MVGNALEERLQSARGHCLISKPSVWSGLLGPEWLFGPPSLFLLWVGRPGHPLPWTADPGPPWSLAILPVPLLLGELVAGNGPTPRADLKLEPLPGHGPFLRVRVAVVDLPGN